MTTSGATLWVVIVNSLKLGARLMLVFVLSFMLTLSFNWIVSKLELAPWPHERGGWGGGRQVAR